MNDTGSTPCILLTPLGERQMKPFTTMHRAGVHLVCGCRDGRMFVIAEETYDVKLSLRPHVSWVSAMAENGSYFATGSYDSNICVFDYDDVCSASSVPRFRVFDAHTDYIMALAFCKNALISSSSDHIVNITEITQEALTVIQTVTISPTVCSIFALEDAIYMGCADGRIEKRLSSDFLTVEDTYTTGSCVKAMVANGTTLGIGCLDGQCHFRGLQALEQKRDTVNVESRVVSMFADGYEFIVFSAESGVFAISAEVKRLVKIPELIWTGIPFKQSVFHACCDDSKLIAVDIDGSTLRERIGSVGYVKACRLAHSTQILCKTTDKTVQLWNSVTLSMEEDYGHCNFNAKAKELSRRPSLYCPIQLDVTTGQVQIIIRNELAKIYSPLHVEAIRALREILNGAVDRKAAVLVLGTTGKNMPKFAERGCLPGWTKFIVDDRYEPKACLFR